MKKKYELLKEIIDEKAMAIIRVDNFERAREIVDGCLLGGVRCLEISYTNFNASDIIKQLDEYYGDKIILGAGTVLDSETARIAMINGAKFIISPTFNREVAKICNRYQISYIPGCSTMSEIIEALEYGADMIKAFPTSSLVGPKIVSTIKTPLPYVPILSSGGVKIDNVSDWLGSGVDCMGIGTLLSQGSTKDIAYNASAIKQQIKKYYE